MLIKFQNRPRGSVVIWTPYTRNRAKENSITPTLTMRRTSLRLPSASNAIRATEGTDHSFSAATAPWHFTSTVSTRPFPSVLPECGCVLYTRNIAFLVSLTYPHNIIPFVGEAMKSCTGCMICKRVILSEYYYGVCMFKTYYYLMIILLQNSTRYGWAHESWLTKVLWSLWTNMPFAPSF